MFNVEKLQEMMTHANRLKEEMNHKLEQTVVEGSSGGGAVTTTMNGRKQLLKIRIDPAAVAGLSGPKPDVEMLEDLVVAAVNDAHRKAEASVQDNAKDILAGMNFPGGLPDLSGIPGLG